MKTAWTLAVVALLLGAIFLVIPPKEHITVENADPPTRSGSNKAPVVLVSEDIVTEEGKEVLLLGLAFDPDGVVELYEWDVDGDGIYDWRDLTTGETTWTFNTPGNYTSVLRVTDDYGDSTIESLHVEVRAKTVVEPPPDPTNLPPIANAGSDAEVNVGDYIEFLMTGIDPDGTIVLYEWDFEGDGIWDASSTVPRINGHTYTEQGVFSAVLRVTDDDNSTATDVRVVTVKDLVVVNQSPIANAGPNIITLVGEEVVLIGTGQDDDGHITLFAWDFDGDNDYDYDSVITGTVLHIYDEVGVYRARLLVFDDLGAFAMDTTTIEVISPILNQPPVADAGSDGVVQVLVDEPLVFRGAGNDPDGEVVLFEWDFEGDGTFDWSSNLVQPVTWTYTRPGLYNAVLRVTDDEGATDEDSREVDVERPTDPTGKWPSPARISIGTIGTFEFDPNEVWSVRRDIFQDGYFSVFDILVHLDDNGDINMEYHFDDEMNTYVIDTINGDGNWWYMAYYDGGWQETNNFRADHYPYKDKMTISIFQEDQSRIDRIFEVWREEVDRLERNDGKVIIPKVIIRGRTQTLTFRDVEVTAHNLRNDTYRDGVITAMDVILSLSDQELITHQLTWYDTIGTAEILHWFVSGINSDIASGTCGFVFEEGSEKLRFGNHIHIPSDYRVLNSPEYEEWFWICL